MTYTFVTLSSHFCSTNCFDSFILSRQAEALSGYHQRSITKVNILHHETRRYVFHLLFSLTFCNVPPGSINTHNHRYFTYGSPLKRSLLFTAMLFAASLTSVRAAQPIADPVFASDIVDRYAEHIFYEVAAPRAWRWW